jgi:ferritin-like metal-binding protein YciE
MEGTMAEAISSQEIIRRYLQDAIASEHSYAAQLERLSHEGDDPYIQKLFAQHAAETRHQQERLLNRLQQLGGSASTIKNVLAHVFSMTPKVSHFGHNEADTNTQNLLLAYAIEQSEVATYEALKAAAESVRDAQTASLVEEIQNEEQQMTQRIWGLIAQSARASVERQTGETWRGQESQRSTEPPRTSPNLP